MKRLETIASFIFGGIFLALSVLVTLEVVLRKAFGMSLQGVDELGGYALALGATLTFTIALLGRAHMRIDIFHEMLPRGVQAILNWLAAVLMAAFAVLLLWNSQGVLTETMDYGSTAATPWATPLIYPQSAWVFGFSVFAVLAIGYAVRATWLLVTRRIDDLNEEFHPKGVSEELKEELEDFEHRVQEAQAEEDTLHEQNTVSEKAGGLSQ